MPNTARFTRAAVAALLIQASAVPAFAGSLTPSPLALPRVTLESATISLGPVLHSGTAPAADYLLMAPGESLQGGPTFLGEIPIPTGVETSMVTYRPRPGASPQNS